MGCKSFNIGSSPIVTLCYKRENNLMIFFSSLAWSHIVPPLFRGFCSNITIIPDWEISLGLLHKPFDRETLSKMRYLDLLAMSMPYGPVPKAARNKDAVVNLIIAHQDARFNTAKDHILNLIAQGHLVAN